ncbi:MAG TPA: DUF2652 domain-containing protein [Saprospiraceae bacterium]|nr:DUF2652 domain-containing protein [Saprospiraceae bacterium]
METKGLLFIPDISGFTQFVNRVEIEHTKLIMQELLEILVNANRIGLEISEIEGDAILFYKFGEQPDLDDLYKQVEYMFCEFHRSLKLYDGSKYCQCQACMSAINLTLKVVTHYGEFTDYKVQQFKKLIGKDVIVAHQLLKNDIDQHEYWLVTDSVIQSSMPSGPDNIMQWSTDIKQTENGDIPFHYAQLGELKNRIPEYAEPDLNLRDKVKVISRTRVYDTDIITLFRTTGMFDYRAKWQPGVLKVEELNHFLPRVGMKYRSVTAEGSTVSYSSNYTFQQDHIEFSETDENKRYCTTYILQKISDDKTKLTIDYYILKKPFAELIFKLTERKKKEIFFEQSMINLEPLLKVIEFPY